MSKIALAGALLLLLFFTYLTAARPAYAFAYALCLLFVIAWAWPTVAIRGMSLTRKLDPGTPTVGEPYEEVIEVRRKGWVPAPWVEVRDLSQIPDYQPGRVISVGGEVVRWKTRGNSEVALGASTRGTLNLYHASQALAAVQGRSYVLPDDIKALAEPVLAHRIILRPNAEMQGQSASKLVAGLLEREVVPQLAYDG